MRGIITVNPFVGLKVMISKKVSEQRKALEIEDLQTLFDEKYFIQDDERPSRYWVPIIAAYSGMRMEEIAQLTRSDLQIIEGVLCFNINDDGEKKLKTLNSARIVPAHSELLRLGFDRFLENKEDDERLFFDLSKKNNGKWSHNLSKWFIRYRRKCGVTEPGKTFHSFRHTVATIWKRQDVHESIPATLLGHSAGGITYTRYGKGYEIDKLSGVIQLITYPGLDIQPWGAQVEL
ncbi:MAG: site-specific integrase [Desulforhopalus sp.]